MINNKKLVLELAQTIASLSITEAASDVIYDEFTPMPLTLVEKLLDMIIALGVPTEIAEESLDLNIVDSKESWEKWIIRCTDSVN